MNNIQLDAVFTDSESEQPMPGELQSALVNLLRHPNDIMILGFALLFYGTYQLVRKAL